MMLFVRLSVCRNAAENRGSADVEAAEVIGFARRHISATGMLSEWHPIPDRVVVQGWRLY